jgi:hypothetical protein
MKKNINKVQISVHKVLYKGHEGEKLRPEIYSGGLEQCLAVLIGTCQLFFYIGCRVSVCRVLTGDCRGRCQWMLLVPGC